MQFTKKTYSFTYFSKHHFYMVVERHFVNQHPTSRTSRTFQIPNIPYLQHLTSPTSQTSHFPNIPHHKHFTSQTSLIPNISRLPHLQYLTSLISCKPNIPHSQHITSPKFHITRILSSLSTNFRMLIRIC